MTDLNESNQPENEQHSSVSELNCFVMPERIIIRKWHEGNKKHEQCTLRELWENGFANGQSFQEHNKHLCTNEYMNENKFHVKSKFFDDVWGAFWSDLSDAEIVIKEA